MHLGYNRSGLPCLALCEHSTAFRVDKLTRTDSVLSAYLNTTRTLKPEALGGVTGASLVPPLRLLSPSEPLNMRPLLHSEAEVRKLIPNHPPPNQFRPPQIFLSSRTLKVKRREESRTGN